MKADIRSIGEPYAEGELSGEPGNQNPLSRRDQMPLVRCAFRDMARRGRDRLQGMREEYIAQMKPTCLEWCPAAKECIGAEKYERLMKTEEEKDMIVVVMKRAGLFSISRRADAPV